MSAFCKYEFYPELNVLFKTCIRTIIVNDISSSREGLIANKVVHSVMKSVGLSQSKF